MNMQFFFDSLYIILILTILGLGYLGLISIQQYCLNFEVLWWHIKYRGGRVLISTVSQLKMPKRIKSGGEIDSPLTSQEDKINRLFKGPLKGNTMNVIDVLEFRDIKS